MTRGPEIAGDLLVGNNHLEIEDYVGVNVAIRQKYRIEVEALSCSL